MDPVYVSQSDWCEQSIGHALVNWEHCMAQDVFSLRCTAASGAALSLGDSW